MELTNEQIQTLRQYKTVMDDDNVRFKDVIKKSLIDDELIIYLLNNKELEDAEADPSDYLGINILPYFLIHPTQHNVQNFICYETSWKEMPRYNGNATKFQQVIFYVLCEEKNNIEKTTGIARHDLIGARIKDIFNWTNKFGTQCHVVSDVPSVTDSDYATRTITFELLDANNIVKTVTGVSRVVNKIGG